MVMAARPMAAASSSLLFAVVTSCYSIMRLEVEVVLVLVLVMAREVVVGGVGGGTP
jgi:hypothetical protein